MVQIYGYKKEEVEKFINYLKKHDNSNLTMLFNKYAKMNKRASGSIRNMYYAIAKRTNVDANFCNKYFNGIALKIDAGVRFNEEETKNVVKAILKGKLEGKSVRQTINELCDNKKTALRYQNKYRNVIKNDTKLLFEIEDELEKETNKHFNNATEYLKKINYSEYKELSVAVENLVNRIKEREVKENKELKSRLVLEQQQNERLKRLLFKEIGVESKM